MENKIIWKRPAELLEEFKPYRLTYSTLWRWGRKGIIRTLRTPSGTWLYSEDDLREKYGE